MSSETDVLERPLGRAATRGGLVTIGAQAVRMGAQMLSVVILARLLSPRDYGMVAMVVAVVGVADILRDLGLSSAAIQARSLSVRQRDNLFWVNTGIGLALTLALVAASPLVARLFGEPGLVPVAATLAWTFAINGLATQYRADLNRRMLFGRLAAIDVAAPVAALVVAVTLAATGAGYWALVAQQLAQAAVMLGLLAVVAGWLPGAPHRDTPMAEFLRFGGNLAGAQVVGYVARNLDSLLLGMRFGPQQLGLYNRAYQLLMVPLGQVRGPLTLVALPVLTRLNDDRARFQAFVERGQLVMGCTFVAGLGIVVGGASSVTALFLGPAWAESAPFLALVAAAGVFQMLGMVGYWTFLARGLTDQLLRLEVVTTSIVAGFLVVGSHWGPLGVAWGFALAPAASWPITFWWLRRHAALEVQKLVWGALRIVTLVSLVAAGARLAASAGGSNVAGEFALAVVGGLAGYAAGFCCVPALRRDITMVASTLRRGLTRV